MDIALSDSFGSSSLRFPRSDFLDERKTTYNQNKWSLRVLEREPEIKLMMTLVEVQRLLDQPLASKGVCENCTGALSRREVGLELSKPRRCR